MTGLAVSITGLYPVHYFRSRARAERSARERVLRASRTRDEFLVKLNHELRTPLSHIKGYTELLSDGSKEVSMLETDVALAQANKRPDWTYGDAP